ncbi:MAG TPA: benzoate-CoA ligase family protein [Xanthobacteraceae bacterium]|nr:benzoate-CoA ligase family protein [Xanthobacteraceae bacterium]
MATSAEDFLQRRPYNAAADFVDANATRGAGGKRAFGDGTRSLSYAELQAATGRCADALRALGLRQESRVALVMLDTVDFPIAFWGAIRAGIVAMPLNTLLNAEQYAYMLEDSRAEALVVSAALAKTVAPVIDRLPQLRVIVIAGGEPKDKDIFGSHETYLFDDVLARASVETGTAATLSDEVAFWLYSSGSTGVPKGTKHVHASLMATAKLFGQDVLGIREDDVVFSAAKLFFAYGLGNAMSFPMSVGATAALFPGRPTPDAVIDVMRREQPTIFYGVPTLYAAMLSRNDLPRGAGSDRLRICVSAGEALPAHIGQQWRERVGVDILDGIGSTEMLHIFLSNRPGDIRYGSSGKPVPGYDARILDESGAEVGIDEVGELVVRGPSAAEGYWNQRQKSRRTFAGEWTYTGDKYMRDGDGYYQYCGRTDDMFKVSGSWLSPFEVEAVLVAHEAVLEAAVIGKEDGDGLIKPKAFIVLKQGFSADEKLFDALKDHVKNKAGPWKYPRWIEVRSELPKTATGKIQRFVLRQQDAEP